MSSLLLFLLFLCFILLVNNVSEASRHLNKKLPSAVVVGTVYCDTCFHQHVSNSNHFISGALVAVECGHSSASKPTFREEVKTDEKGEFKAHLPFSISKHVKKIEGCSVKLIRSSEPYCAVASTATSSTLHLKSKKQGTHIFSAGFFTFKPLNEPQLCNQKPSIKNSRDINSLASLIQNPDDLSFPQPLKDPPEPFLPPLPDLPKLPSLPTLPLTPPGIIGPPLKSTPTSDELSNEKAFGFPFPPNPFNPPSLFPPNPFNPPSLFPPNPFLPPPSVLPPLPFQPPPSLIPPIFPSPPPSLFPPINFPPLPGLIPSPPPPPPSLFPPIFPRLPPFPFQPAPGFPGVPPASSTKKASP